jgi:hypothetical protein
LPSCLLTSYLLSSVLPSTPRRWSVPCARKAFVIRSQGKHYPFNKPRAPNSKKLKVNAKQNCNRSVHVQWSSRIGAEPSAGVAVQIAVGVVSGCVLFACQTCVRVQSVVCVVRSCDRSAVVARKTVLAQVTSGRLANLDIVLGAASLLQVLFVQRATTGARVIDLDLVWPVNDLAGSWS